MVKIDDKYKREQVLQRSQDGNKLGIVEKKKYHCSLRTEGKGWAKTEEVTRGWILQSCR